MKKTLSMLVMVTLLLSFATALPATAQTNRLLELYIGDTTAYVNAVVSPMYSSRSLFVWAVAGNTVTKPRSSVTITNMLNVFFITIQPPSKCFLKNLYHTLREVYIMLITLS